MGRMADARKRARREGVTATEPEPAGVQEHGGDTASAARDLVFPSESTGSAASSGIVLPASGLAEDVLRQIEGAQPSARPEDSAPQASPPPTRLELPASGLAEEILGGQSATSAPSPGVPEAGPAAHEAPAVGGHSLSFFAAPTQEHRAAAEATEHLVTFYLDREEYGIDVRQVQEIRRVGEITVVPRAPEFVRGVINLRGRILPVLDLKKKLGLGEVEDSKSARIVVARVRDRLLGLLVDGASQVPKIPVSRIEAAPEEVFERGGDYIRGVAKLDDRLIILVDLERLLAHELRASSSASASDGSRATAGEANP